MKPRNREINIFNISMLDVISGAMGAFLIIMVILLPYYKPGKVFRGEIRRLEQVNDSLRRELSLAIQRAKDAERRATDAERRTEELGRRMEEVELSARRDRERAETAKEALRRAEESRSALRKQLSDYKQKLQKNYLVVMIEWTTKDDDVDLHVIDPQGGHFFWRQKILSGHRGRLSMDTQRGPGLEVWQIDEAIPGNYVIKVNLFKNRSGTTTIQVKLWVFHRFGSREIAPFTVSRVISGTGYLEEIRDHLPPVTTINVSPGGQVTFH